jgi:ElaB/YqjD/DUF883 family membrane-anchored ribosome-binding protein
LIVPWNDVTFCMNAEELAETQLRAEELNFDAPEFDGLREGGKGSATAWLREADRFVRDNPWLCIGIVAAAACALGWAMAPKSSRAKREDEPE